MTIASAAISAILTVLAATFLIGALILKIWSAGKHPGGKEPYQLIWEKLGRQRLRHDPHSSPPANDDATDPTELPP
jgi:hypothetical protein